MAQRMKVNINFTVEFDYDEYVAYQRWLNQGIGKDIDADIIGKRRLAQVIRNCTEDVACHELNEMGINDIDFIR